MRGLTDNQIRDIELVIRRRMIPLSAAMLEKDLLVRDVVAAVCRAGEAMGAPILFCGGTALSQAYSVIDRMSEDADFRIIVPATVTGQNGRRRFLSAVKAAIQKSLEAAGFPVDGEMKARNGNEYMMGQFAYRPAFAAPATHDEILRPHIKLEITAFTPLSTVEVRPLQTILDRIGAPQKEPPTAPLVPVVSIADTVADKIVGICDGPPRIGRTWGAAPMTIGWCATYTTCMPSASGRPIIVRWRAWSPWWRRSSPAIRPPMAISSPPFATTPPPCSGVSWNL